MKDKLLRLIERHDNGELSDHEFLRSIYIYCSIEQLVLAESPREYFSWTKKFHEDHIDPSLN